MLIRIRESLNKMDMDTDCKYDLVSLYESCKLTEQEKEKLVKMIYTNEDPATIFNSLNKTHTRQQGSRPSNSSITNICEDFDDFDDLYIPNEDRYELVTRKDVLDSDGFYTEYTWYKDNLTGKNIFIFGDPDFYTPENSTPDYETENDEDAQEWFDSYEGLANDLDELEENTGDKKRFKKPIKEDVQETQTPSDHGMSSLINNLIISEYDAIDMYNSAIASAEAEQQFDIIPVLKDIITEEQTHVGQLQTLAKLFDPSADEVEKGNIEADKQLDTYDNTPDSYNVNDLKEAINVYSADDVDDVESLFQSIDRTGTDEEVAIAAIMYNLGTTMREAREILPTLSKDKIKDYVDYYYLRDLPSRERIEIWNNRKNISSITG